MLEGWQQLAVLQVVSLNKIKGGGGERKSEKERKAELISMGFESNFLRLISEEWGGVDRKS